MASQSLPGSVYCIAESDTHCKFVSLAIIVFWSFNYNMFQIQTFRIYAIKCNRAVFLYLNDTAALVGVMWITETIANDINGFFSFQTWIIESREL